MTDSRADQPAPPALPPAATPGAVSMWTPPRRAVVVPAPPRPMDAPTSARSRVTRGLSGALQALMWATAGFALLGTFAVGRAIGAYHHLHDAFGTAAARNLHETWLDADDDMMDLSGTVVLTALVVFILFVIWLYQTHARSTTRQPDGRRWSAGWAVAGCFIPAANAVVPKLVLDEIERIAGTSQPAGLRWRLASTSPLGWVWWYTLLAGAAAWFSANVAFVEDAGGGDPGPVYAYYGLRIAAFACWTVAGATGALHVRHVTRNVDTPADVVTR